MRCPNCGTQNASNFNFCQKCGTRLSSVASPSNPESDVGSPFTRINYDSKNTKSKNFINVAILIVGITTVCAIAFIIFLMNRGENKRSSTPDHFGVYLKEKQGLVELSELELFSLPVESKAQISAVTHQFQPQIIIWRSNTNLDYLDIYKLGQYLNQEERIRYQASRDQKGIITIFPSVKLESGNYCIVQGDPLAAFLPGWCFQVELD